MIRKLVKFRQIDLLHPSSSAICAGNNRDNVVCCVYWWKCWYHRQTLIGHSVCLLVFKFMTFLHKHSWTVWYWRDWFTRTQNMQHPVYTNLMITNLNRSLRFMIMKASSYTNISSHYPIKLLASTHNISQKKQIQKRIIHNEKQYICNYFNINLDTL